MSALSDPDTLAFYAAEAPVYSASGPEGISRHLAVFLELLPAEASILELGCGGGRDAAHMMALGFSVEPTDGVVEIAAQAEARLGCPVRVMAFGELDAFEHYDAVVANASLLHVPRPGLPDVLQRVWRSLKPGGWHMASYKGGGTEGRDRFGRYFNYLLPADAAAAYPAGGDWASIEIEESIGGGYDGVQCPWIKVTARKA
jgi:SAM-dependent methyltransferase